LLSLLLTKNGQACGVVALFRNENVKFQLIAFKTSFRLFSVDLNIAIKTRKTRGKLTISHVFLQKIHKTFFGKYWTQIGDRDHAYCITRLKNG
jgi:hypothetical protein